ncbi:MAG: hypothetical protein DME25_20170, partial [Verrucomicrobia bacterium]
SGATIVGAGKTSTLGLPVPAGRTNFVVVDGVVTGGVAASGTLNLNYTLVPITLNALPMTGGAAHLQVFGAASLRITIQYSSDLRTWTPLVTATMATSTLDYVDATSINMHQRFYRVLLLP